MLHLPNLLSFQYLSNKENFFESFFVINYLMRARMIEKKSSNVAVNVRGNENASLPKRS
jgi:hypothetical protein